MADDPLEDIATRARVLSWQYPSSAEFYHGCSSDPREVRWPHNMPGPESTEYEQMLWEDCHYVTSHLWYCDKDRDKLVRLIYTYLPEALPLEYVRLDPPWSSRDRATNWPAIVAELRRIEDAALVKLYSRPVDKFPNDARDKWIYEQCLDPDTPLKTIITNLAERSEWEPIKSIPGIKQAANRYADRHGLPPIPTRQPGRPARK